MNRSRLLLATTAALLALTPLPPAHAIMAGGETELPADSPSHRLDPLGAASPFNAVGALAIASGGFNYKGSGVALSRNWVLTAGHNLDLNDNGLPDPGLAISFHLPGLGAYSASGFYTHPGYTGFGNPSIQRDLGLLYFAAPLPTSLFFPSLSYSLQLGDQVTLVGFGRSGYGSYGYTTSASLTDRAALAGTLWTPSRPTILEAVSRRSSATTLTRRTQPGWQAAAWGTT